MAFALLDQPSYHTQGLEIKDFDYLLNPKFQTLQQAVYAALSPARNASNSLCRGLRWGILLNDTLTWSELDEYQLSAQLNPEEAGKVRQMDLLPETYLRTCEVERLIRDVFQTFHPGGDSHKQAYMVQLSGIRYAPTLAKACYPSPDMPHQDGFNSGIVVLARTPNMIGGHSRIYSLEDKARFEAQLAAGQGLFVKDSTYKHQVLPMLQDSQIGGVYAPCYRDILIVRVDPAKR